PYVMHISKNEYENMGGRAGRLSLANDYGRSILIAGSEFEFLKYRKLYLDAPYDGLQPQLAKVCLATHALNLVASGIAANEEQISDFLLNTLSGHICWQSPEDKDKVTCEIVLAVEQCIKYGLMSQDGQGNLIPNKLGTVCAAKGISVETALEIISWANKTKNRRTDELELLYLACRTKDAQGYYVNMSTQEYQDGKYPERLRKALSPEAIETFSDILGDSLLWGYTQVKAMKKALFLRNWIEGVPAINIEKSFQSLSGAMVRVAEGISWIVDAAGDIMKVLGFDKQDIRTARRLSRRLVYGVTETGLALLKLGVKGFGRSHVRLLAEMGIEKVEDLEALSEIEIGKVIRNKTLGGHIKEKVTALMTQRAEICDEAPDLTGDNIFRKSGQAWVVRYDGNESFLLQPTKGTAYLHILLSEQGQEHDVVDMAFRVARNPRLFILGDAGEALDDEAFRSYRAHYRDLESQMQKAKENNDMAGQTKIQEELTWIADELSKAQGLKGKPRKVSDDQERIRKAVQMAISRTIKEIGQHDPDMAGHLKENLKCGARPCYRLDEKIDWSV
ncbi:MAG: hypothetical protein JW944_08615, partial [Deltaproteobacteria bacterium]|nr:hypothetical protein [Deltaproteobacteria bacterium]